MLVWSSTERKEEKQEKKNGLELLAFVLQSLG